MVKQAYQFNIVNINTNNNLSMFYQYTMFFRLIQLSFTHAMFQHSMEPPDLSKFFHLCSQPHFMSQPASLPDTFELWLLWFVSPAFSVAVSVVWIWSHNTSDHPRPLISVFIQFPSASTCYPPQFLSLSELLPIFGVKIIPLFNTLSSLLQLVYIPQISEIILFFFPSSSDLHSFNMRSESPAQNTAN